MSMYLNRRRLIAAASALGMGAAAPGRTGAQSLPGFRPPCESERDVAGWTVTANFAAASSGEHYISKWECRRNFHTHFGIRIVYDSSHGPTPRLQIWHNYKNGDFKMVLPDASELTASVKADYALTTSPLRPRDVEFLRNQPVRIEYYQHGGKWRVFQTDGLPEAIAAAESDLALVKQKQSNKECSADKLCFITTAVCGVVGLPDDCFELRQLRAFRDRFAKREPANACDVKTYYELAPQVLSQIERHPDGQRILLSEYWRAIAPCALLSALRCDFLVEKLYKSAINRLRAYAAL